MTHNLLLSWHKNFYLPLPTQNLSLRFYPKQKYWSPVRIHASRFLLPSIVCLSMINTVITEKQPCHLLRGEGFLFLTPPTQNLNLRFNPDQKYWWLIIWYAWYYLFSSCFCYNIAIITQILNLTCFQPIDV